MVRGMDSRAIPVFREKRRILELDFDRVHHVLRGKRVDHVDLTPDPTRSASSSIINDKDSSRSTASSFATVNASYR